MARYNTTFPVTTRSGVGTISTPDSGLFTTLTGTAPYTITLPNPTLFAGAHQSFWNNTSGVVTLSTPSGTIRTAGADATTWAMPTDTMVSLASNGVDYILYVNTGGPQNATTAAFSGNTLVAGTATFTVGTGTTTLGGNLAVNGGTITASSAFTPSSAYHLITKNYLETNYGLPWEVQTTSITVTSGGRYFVDTNASALTLTLPTGQAVGAEVHFIDYSRTFNVRPLTIGNNGQRIMGTIDTMTVNTQGAAFSLVWSGTTNGWLITQGI
jgi:hypothetical protein